MVLSTALEGPLISGAWAKRSSGAAVGSGGLPASLGWSICAAVSHFKKYNCVQFRERVEHRWGGAVLENRKLDAIDLRILKELQTDGRITNVELSRRAKITAPPCLRRMR